MANRYQRDNQKAQIELGQTIQWPQDTKGVTIVICLPLYCLSYFDWCLLITSLVSFGHCIVYPTSIYAFWLPLWYLLAIVVSVLLWFMPSDYPFALCWPLYRLPYFEFCLLIIPSVSFGHCIVCPSSIDAFWLPLWYLLAIVSSLLLCFMPSVYPFGIFLPFSRLFRTDDTMAKRYQSGNQKV
jgi:hypothetical protein